MLLCLIEACLVAFLYASGVPAGKSLVSLGIARSSRGRAVTVAGNEVNLAAPASPPGHLPSQYRKKREPPPWRAAALRGGRRRTIETLSW